MMMNEKIRHAYDSIHPTDEQKNRMLRNIVTQMPAENGKNYTSYPTEPKRRSVIFAGLALLLIVCASTLYLLAKQPEDNPQLNQGDTNPTETRIEEFERHLIQFELDLEEKELTYELIEQWCSNPLFQNYLMNSPSTGNQEDGNIGTIVIRPFGYLVTDLDENGTPEVIFSDGKVIYDLYTLERGEYLHLFSGGEQNTYELCKENYIFNTVSDGEGGTTYQYFRLNGSELLKEVSLVHEVNAEEESWYLMGGFQYSINRMPIVKEQAANIMDRYPTLQIEITLFAEKEERVRPIP
jgi:hypothetical protein